MLYRVAVLTLCVAGMTGCSALRIRKSFSYNEKIVHRETIGATLGFMSGGVDPAPSTPSSDAASISGELYGEGFVQWGCSRYSGCPIGLGIRSGFAWATSSDGSKYTGIPIQLMLVREVGRRLSFYGGGGPLIRGKLTAGAGPMETNGLRMMGGLSYSLIRLGRDDSIDWAPYMEFGYMRSGEVAGRSFAAATFVFGLVLQLNGTTN